MADPRPETTTNNEQSQQQPETGINAAIKHLTTKPIVTLLLIIRIVTLIFTILYLVPITSISSGNLYQKALLSNAAISALRLHQRLPPFRVSREYFSMLLLEDSAHYLFYSLIFISNQPITLVLLPIALFSFLHSCSAILTVFQAAGYNGPPKRLLEKVGQNPRSILLTIALTEITMMPTIIFAILAGLASIFTPLMYYQFLALRYSSRRNPYNQQAFHWLRIYLESYALSERCPMFLRNLILKSIQFVSRFAPQIHQ